MRGTPQFAAYVAAITRHAAGTAVVTSSAYTMNQV